MTRAPARRLNVAFFGTPSFAWPALEALQRHHDVAVVVTQPDRPVGRGRSVASPPIALHARALGLPLRQPERLRRDEAFAQDLVDFALDVAVTVAYGQILPAALLEVPREGFLNVHASLLPRWRGAAPIQHALIAGDTETGITIMQTEAGLDTGPIRLARAQAISPDDDATTLFASLAELGARTLLEALDALTDGDLPLVPQDAARATSAPRLTRDDGRVRWSDPARRVHDRHRGVVGWPGSWCYRVPGDDAVVKLYGMSMVTGAAASAAALAVQPGTVIGVEPEGLVIACGEGAVRVREVQTAGRPRMAATAWAHGARVAKGVRLG